MLLTDNQTLLLSYNRHGRYSNHLLHLAEDLATRLLKAFQPNGLAYGTVNLRFGVQKEVILW